MRGNKIVREARRRAGLSQAELASRVGTTQSAIARMERGRSAPSLERVVELVRACGFDLELRLVPLDESAWELAEANLRLSPEERFERLDAGAGFIEAARQAMRERRDG